MSIAQIKMPLKLLIISFILIPVICAAQNNAVSINIPMKNGKINFETNYSSNGSFRQKELLNKAHKWLKNIFPDDAKSIKTDGADTEITGAGIFKIVTNKTGNYYLVKFAIVIKANTTGYIFSMYNFYEKPVEIGISNEYSKLEYRWRDFRQGKPWSGEDEILFRGLVSNETSIVTSFEKSVAVDGNQKNKN